MVNQRSFFRWNRLKLSLELLPTLSPANLKFAFIWAPLIPKIESNRIYIDYRIHWFASKPVIGLDFPSILVMMTCFTPHFFPLVFSFDRHSYSLGGKIRDWTQRPKRNCACSITQKYKQTTKKKEEKNCFYRIPQHCPPAFWIDASYRSKEFLYLFHFRYCSAKQFGEVDFVLEQCVRRVELWRRLHSHTEEAAPF